MRIAGFELPISWATMTPAGCLTALLLALFYLGPEWQQALYYRAPWVFDDGQWWRLLTAQWVHYDAPHLWLNVLGLWLWWLLYIEYLPNARSWWRLAPIMVASTLVHALSVQGTSAYAGFSGTLYGMFAYAAILDGLAGRFLSWAILAAIVLKNLYDVATLPMPADLAIYSHIGGMAMAAVLALWQYFRSRTQA